MATTAIGTLIPILGEAGETKTHFGMLLLGAGAAGEFGPILLVTVLISTQAALDAALVLPLFAVLTVAAAVIAMRSAGAGIWSSAPCTPPASCRSA